MGKIIDISPFLNARKEPIEVDIETINNVFGFFFGVPLSICEVVGPDDEFLGYSVMLEVLNLVEPQTIEERAAINWNIIFQSRLFRDVASILSTFMDCVLEQRDIQASMDNPEQ